MPECLSSIIVGRRTRRIRQRQSRSDALLIRLAFTVPTRFALILPLHTSVQLFIATSAQPRLRVDSVCVPTSLLHPSFVFGQHWIAADDLS